MNPSPGRLRASFSTKVLVPVLASMVLLVATTAWLVNQRLTQQFQAEAARRLATADSVFRNSQKIHTRNLLFRFRNLPKEPRYHAAFQNADLPTLKAQIADLPKDQDVEIVLFTSADGKLLAKAMSDGIHINLNEFVTNSAVAVREALRDEETPDTIQVSERLFDVVSIPVRDRDRSDELTGVLTFGTEIGDNVAQEFSLVTQSKIVLLANGRVIASTVPGAEYQEPLARLFRDFVTSSAEPFSGRPREILVGDEHYFYSGGQFASLSGDHNLGYLLLSSYEQPLRALHQTQQTLMMLSLAGIVLGAAVVWFLVRKVTAPLRALRDSAEAVGQGDFSRRVQVNSSDECGELATVFNRMTQNLKTSREELEQTVDRLKSTQAQLVQSEKLSGIGEFVAGVAHELNNPLTTVMGFSELLKQADAKPEHERFLDMIHKSALRCQKIVQNLLSFARRHPPERKLSSLNELVNGAVEFLQYQLRTSNIEVTTQLAPRLPRALVDPHQVQQVFLNIINNARQAIEAHQPTGAIRISTELCGTMARVRFKDNGPGIPEANMSKVFDPFFTTKEAGKGTGLGLSLCYGIIKEHGGSIAVHSPPGQGATFVIELPLAHEANMADIASEAPRDDRRKSTEGRGKKVLVVDDEESILQMVRETLAQNGFEVDIARDGETALHQLEQKPYDLALCDWKMPGINGRQVYERVAATNPALAERIIFITGDVVNDTTQKFLAERKKVCLSKPFSLTDFRAAIDQALTAS
jgi:signal transduction histidine kinase/ActR/RegA family two-component response regulator